MSGTSTKSGACGACGVYVEELRRGRCFWCYQNWMKNRPVGVGARCTSCGDRRRDNLRNLDLGATWAVVCHSCGSRAEKLRPRPRTVEALCQRLARDRRWNDRRLGTPGAPVVERRGACERRQPRDGAEAFARLVATLPEAPPDMPRELAAERAAEQDREALAALADALWGDAIELDPLSEGTVIEMDAGEPEADPFAGSLTAIHERIAGEP